MNRDKLIEFFTKNDKTIVKMLDFEHIEAVVDWMLKYIKEDKNENKS